MASAKINSIGLFIDGGYYALIDQGLVGLCRRVNLKSLIRFIQKSIAEHFDLDPDSVISILEITQKINIEPRTIQL